MVRTRNRSRKKKSSVPKFELDSEDDGEEKVVSKKKLCVSSDDEDGCEDLSLKIVEKALLRASSSKKSDSERVVEEDAKEEEEVKIDVESSDVVDDDEADVSGKESDEKEAEICKATELDTSLGMNVVDKVDNVVLRKLLRGPRYFDPPDSNWGACYNCGESGHVTANCTSAKRKKPCFVCGSLEHNAKHCKKGRDCFICQQGGHQAKDCPEKSKRGSYAAKLCLKCGDSGHDIFSCKNNYCPDDLKELQCYICKRFGHLCCVIYSCDGPSESSCYRCGQLGHTGLACPKFQSSTNISGMGSSSSCYKCGEEGHFARECASSAKIAKRKREQSNFKRSFSEGNIKKQHVEGVSKNHGQDKPRKSKKPRYEEPTTSTPKQRGGWISEDPGDFHRRNYRANGWRSPATPNYYANQNGHNFSPSNQASSSTYGRKLQFGSSASNGSNKMYQQQRFSASRFSNGSGHGMRHYNWP